MTGKLKGKRKRYKKTEVRDRYNDLKKIESNKQESMKKQQLENVIMTVKFKGKGQDIRKQKLKNVIMTRKVKRKRSYQKTEIRERYNGWKIQRRKKKNFQLLNLMMN